MKNADKNQSLPPYIVLHLKLGKNVKIIGSKSHWNGLVRGAQKQKGCNLSHIAANTSRGPFKTTNWV